MSRLGGLGLHNLKITSDPCSGGIVLPNTVVATPLQSLTAGMEVIESPVFPRVVRRGYAKLSRVWKRNENDHSGPALGAGRDL